MPDITKNTYSQRQRPPFLTSVEFNDGYSQAISISISQDVKRQLFDKAVTQSNNYVSVKLIGSDIFDRYIVYRVSDKYLAGSNRIVIDDTSRFGDSSNITIDKALINKTTPIEITTAIISFPGQLYDLLKKHTGVELFNVLKNQLGLDLIHEGSSLKSLGKVLLCEPVDQGILTENSVITLIKDDSAGSNEGTQNIAEDDSTDLDLDFSSYLTKTTTNSEHEFEVKPLERIFVHSIPQPNDSDDTEALGYVRTSDLSKIGAHSGDYVELLIDEHNIKLVKLLSFIEPNNYQDGTIYLSPIFLINNGSPKAIKIRKTHTKQNLSTIPIASSMTIVKIASPQSLRKSNELPFMSNLKTYFEAKQRIVSVNDLIPITFDLVLARSLTQSNPEISLPLGNPDTVVWFKITEISGSEGEAAGKQYIVDPSHTSMSQSGTSNDRPPDLTYDWIKYLGLRKHFDYLDGADEVFQYSKKLAKLLKSSNVRKSLKTTVLLQSLNRNVGKSFIVENLAHNFGLHLCVIDGYDVLNPSSESKTIGLIRGLYDKVVEQSEGLIVYLKHIEALAQKKENEKPGLLASKLTELIDDYTSAGVIFIASTNDADKIPEELRSQFRFEIEVPVPSEEERRRIFSFLLKEASSTVLRDDISLSSLSLQSAGLSPRDLLSIVENAKSLAWDRLEEMSDDLGIELSELTNNNPIKLIPQDFEKSINDARSKFSDSIGAPKIPNVKWDDIGGLDLVKDEILDTIDMPLKHPELFANGVKKRSGILFYGPPGTGKTLLAKAIATNFSLNFFSVKGPELLNMYIGESEANVRKVFQRARDAKPCVVFFDELDSVAPKRGNQGDSGGVMDRIVSQLLAELDGMSGGDAGDGVFVVGATNRPDLLDEALLRPGRFDKMLYLGISDTHEKQQKILEALTRKFKLDPSVNLQNVAESCPYNFTGADFYALCSDSMLNAMTRVASEVDKKVEAFNAAREETVSTRWWFDNVSTKEDINVLVKEEDFMKARKELTASVSAEELEHYLKVRENFEGGKKQQ
jgi:peroxin-6